MLTTVFNLGSVQPAAAKIVVATNVQGTAVVQGTVLQGKETANTQREDEQEPAAGQNGKTNSRSSFQNIVTRNIFQAVKELTVKKEEEKPPPPQPTVLDLTLLGTIYGTREADSRAIIFDNKKKNADIFYIGDNIQGASISGVERGKVILKLNNREEILLLKDRADTTRAITRLSDGRRRLPPEKATDNFEYGDTPSIEIDPDAMKSIAPVRRLVIPRQVTEEEQELQDAGLEEGDVEVDFSEDIPEQSEVEAGAGGEVLDELDALEAEARGGAF